MSVMKYMYKDMYHVNYGCMSYCACTTQVMFSTCVIKVSLKVYMYVYMCTVYLGAGKIPFPTNFENKVIAMLCPLGFSGKTTLG